VDFLPAALEGMPAAMTPTLEWQIRKLL